MFALVLGCVFTYLALTLALPWLRSVALAKVNERSAHHTPTPQGGGLIIFIVLFAITLLTPPLWGTPLFLMSLAMLLSLLGFVDDRLELAPLLRLFLQMLFVAASLYFIGLPPMIAAPLAFFGLLWYVNLSNFMDGIDFMTVLHVAFVSLGLWFLTDEMLFLLLLGGILGFAPFNFPKAKLFIGDAGSLPFGLLLGAGLIMASQKHGLTPPLILTLYYVSDATLTLLSRLSRREKIWLPHKTHFYQRALENLTLPQILTRLAFVQFILLGLALASKTHVFLALGLALTLVGLLLWDFSRKRGAYHF